MLVPMLLLVTAFCALSATAAAAPNICTITGVNKQVAAAVLGKGSTFGNAATVAPTSRPTSAPTVRSGPEPPAPLPTSRWSSTRRTHFPTLVSNYERGSARRALRGLGSGAVYLLSSDHNIDIVLFKTTKYTVLIDNTAFRGGSPSSYPTETEYLALAQAIHPHLG